MELSNLTLWQLVLLDYKINWLIFLKTIPLFLISAILFILFLFLMDKISNK